MVLKVFGSIWKKKIEISIKKIHTDVFIVYCVGFFQGVFSCIEAWIDFF